MLDSSRAASEIVEAARLMYAARLLVGLEGNLSARLDDDGFLTTPAGRCKGFLKPEELVLVDADGAPRGEGRPSTEFAMHAAIYAARPDAGAVVHGHPAYATAFATAGLALDRCVLPEMVVGVGRVPVSDYGTPSTPQVAAAVAPLAREHDAILLRNHGLVVLGRTPMDAFHKLESVEQSARIQWLARALGGARALGPEQVEQLHAVREVYGLADRAPACEPGSEELPQAGESEAGQPRSELARMIAEEIARELGGD